MTVCVRIKKNTLDSVGWCTPHFIQFKAIRGSATAMNWNGMGELVRSGFDSRQCVLFH